jgi:hypothetical protein
MNAAKLAALAQALGGVDWTGLGSNPALTVEAVAEAVLPCFGPAGLVAADAIALFIAVAHTGLVKPGAHGDGQAAASVQSHGPYQGR